MGHNHYLLRRDCIKVKVSVRQNLFIKIHSENKRLPIELFIRGSEQFRKSNSKHVQSSKNIFRSKKYF